MSDEVCKNCKWFELNLIMGEGQGFCCRFPKHIHIRNFYLHYCGEFKEREE